MRCTERKVCSHICLPPKVKVADTVGAGDSFTATYVMARLNGATIREAHHLAVGVAAFVCTQSGAVNPVPERLKTFMKY